MSGSASFQLFELVGIDETQWYQLSRFARPHRLHALHCREERFRFLCLCQNLRGQPPTTTS
jgi:hypothetical protein